MRLFVAACPPVEAVEHLRQAIPRTGVRLTKVEGWHLTLVFLGDVPDDQPVRRALDEVPLPALELRLSGAGRFGAAVWAGVEGDLLGLAELQEEVKKALGSSDDRPFRPHVTVAHDRGQRVLHALEHYEGPSWTVTGFTLFRSHYPDGGGYERLAEWG